MFDDMADYIATPVDVHKYDTSSHGRHIDESLYSSSKGDCDD
jgi:hypothetical protein